MKNWLVRAEVFVAGVLGGVVMLLASFDLVTRYIWKGASKEWFGEVVVYLVVWNAFLVCGILVAQDNHVRVDSLVSKLSVRSQKTLAIISDVVCLGVCVLLLWLAGNIAWGEYEVKIFSSSPLRFPMWIYSSSLAVGALLMSLHYIIKLQEIVTGRWRPSNSLQQDI